MIRTRLSLFYLAGYLIPAGLLLLFAPTFALRLLLSNGEYGDVFPRMARDIRDRRKTWIETTAICSRCHNQTWANGGLNKRTQMCIDQIARILSAWRAKLLLQRATFEG